MLTIVKDLIDKLSINQVRYCHWKSNKNVQEALAGIGDLDLFVDREQVGLFESTLGHLGFKRANDLLQTPCPSIFHFYGLDPETGIIVHLHVYYRVITGETILKNYCLPLENLLLSNCELVEGLPIPQRGAELIVFVLRMMLKHFSILELLLLKRGGENIQAELAYLLEDHALEKAKQMLAEFLPSIDFNLFNNCVNCIKKNGSFWRYFSLSNQLRKQIKLYNRLTPVAEWRLRINLYANRIWWRLCKLGKAKQLASGGLVIAFVGPEATGKSTLVENTKSWLGQIFNINSVHLGKPPATFLTAIPNLGLPLFRKLFNQDRVSYQQHQNKEELPQNSAENNTPKKVSLVYALRSVFVAWERYQLALKIRRQAANGKLVICDRYPSAIVGAMDSARLSLEDHQNRQFLSYLAQLEHRLYSQIPPADLIIKLTVSVEVAIARNQQRQKQEPTDYLISRHTKTLVPSFPQSKTLEVSSDQSKEETIKTVKSLLWKHL